MNPLSPHADSIIARRYSVSSLDQKIANKTALQEEIGWIAEPKRPVVCLPAGMSEKLGGKVFEELLPGLLSLPIELLVVGKGSAAYGTLFTTLAKEHRHRIHIVPDTEEWLRKMYAGSDIALFLADPSRMEELQTCLRYGVVPISVSCKLLEDYDPVQEAGNAFVCEQSSPWLCFASLVRATETYKLPYDWRTIQKYGMESAKTL